MKKAAAYITTIFFAIGLLFGCTTGQPNKTAAGAGIGAVTGGVVGAVIGHQSGHKKGGAVIGAVAGGAIGALIGNRMEKQAKELEQVQGMEDVSYDPEQKKIDATLDVLFDFDKANIRSSERSKLDELARVFSKYPENIVMIEGHTDSAGTDNYNLNLSEERAQSVAAYLRSQNIDISSLTARGYGESRPVASNATAEGREKNRRVEIKITADPSRVPQSN